MAEPYKNQELVASVKRGDVEEVRRLTNALGADSLRLWAPGFNLLCESLRNKQLEIAKLLVNHGCSLGERFSGDNALHVAVVYGDFEVIQMIINKGLSSKQENKKGMNSLHLFPQRHPVDPKCSQILNLLLESETNINFFNHKKSGFSPLHFAAKCGSAEMISLFYNAQFNINKRARNLRTPLHYAALNSQTRAVHDLLIHGADQTLIDCNQRTPVCLAVEGQDIPKIQAFLKNSKTLKNDAMLIYCAVKTMNKAIVEMLLKHGASPDSRSEQTGKTAIHIAVEKGSLEIVSLLLQYGADPNAIQGSLSAFKRYSSSILYTGLHIAAEKEKLEIFQLLLQYGAKPEIIDGNRKTPLHLAIKNGSVPIVAALLNHGCEISSLFAPEEPHGYTPLHIAVEIGNEDIVTLFLNVGIPVNSPTKVGFIPLHLAVKKGNTGMVKLLLKYNADPSAQGPSTIETPLFLAAEIGSCEIVDIISEVSSNRTGEWQEGYFSLFVAAYHGHECVVKKLLEKRVNPNANIRNYLTPLQAAAQQGHENIVKILLEHQAEVNPKSTTGNDRFSTPLIAACLSGHEAIVEILLSQGADLNAKVFSEPKELKSKVECLLTYGYYSYTEVLSKELKIGYTPIHFAVASGKKEFVKMILKRGADVNAKAEDDNSSPLCVAVEKQHEDVVSYLLESGASIDDKDSGRFVLLKAIRLKNLNIVKLLLKYKAPLNFTCYFKQMEGYTPLHIAIMESSLEIVEALLKEGSVVDTSSEVELPLHCAVERNDKQIISKLIEYGACIDSKCSLGLTPFLHAVADFKRKACESVSDMKSDIIKLFLECGADANSKDAFNASAFENVHIGYRGLNQDFYANGRLLKLFLKEGFDLNTRIGGSTRTVLHYEVEVGNTEEVKLMLQHDVDLNLVDDEKHTAFHYAIDGACGLVNDVWEETETEDEDEDRNPMYRGLDFDDFSSDYYSSIRNPVFYVQHLELARSMTKALARIQSSGECLNSENLALINRKFVRNYYNRCKEELEELKKRKIIKRVTYFNILIANENKLADYANNVNIIEAFEFENLKDFPLYEEELKARFERGVTRKNVFEMSTNILNESLEIELPTLVIDEIFKYLRCVDLKNLCRARNPLIFVSPDLSSDAPH